ncbi:hypothetical protein [Nocardioides sp. SR21]|uniref:hypothetical protein n=1 Tax=Nocardioides sp. SR21 TaxID=2919501 RepID=UPI001FA9C57B|nr:hypothetical protein [Nocardioides sp. SR21]
MTVRAGGGYWYAHAIRESALPPPSRHIALTLAGVADNDSGEVRVSLKWLAGSTGLALSTVKTHLNNLENGAWVIRHRPPVWKARQEGERTRYVLTYPHGVMAGRRPTHGRETAESRPGRGHVSTETKAVTALRGDDPHTLPHAYGGACACPNSRPTTDGDCVACGGCIPTNDSNRENTD